MVWLQKTLSGEGRGRIFSHVCLEGLLGMHRVIYLEFSPGVVGTFHTYNPIRGQEG